MVRSNGDVDNGIEEVLPMLEAEVDGKVPEAKHDVS